MASRGHAEDPAGHAAHGRAAGGSRSLSLAFWLAVGLLGVEAVGGAWSRSLALWSDAGHMLTDVLALGLAWFADRVSRRPPTPTRSYGFHRVRVLTALVNAATLLVVAGALLVEAVGRLRHPVPVHPRAMATVAAIGLAGNLWIGLRLSREEDSAQDLNLRSAWWHAMGDAGASLGVLVASALIALTGAPWWDPALSMGIGLLIARGAWGILGRTVGVLMEGAPPGIRPEEVARSMEADPAVVSCHHLHIWSLDGTRTALSGHLVLRDTSLSEAGAVLDRVGRRLRREFGIAHTTLQPEVEGEAGCPEADCSAEP